MKRSLVAFVPAFAGMWAAVSAAIHIRRFLEPSYHVDWASFDAVVQFLGGMLGRLRGFGHRPAGLPG